MHLTAQLAHAPAPSIRWEQNGWPPSWTRPPVDPLLVPVRDAGTGHPPPMEGFLMGAYCTEGDLLSRRRLRFPLGVAQGDLIVFPNTAGYLMHFVETDSHQFPLARNLVVGPGGRDPVTPDPIDDVPGRGRLAAALSGEV